MRHRFARNPLTCIPLIAALLTAGPVLAEDLTGQASVIDGDTIEIHGTRIRLWELMLPKAPSCVVAKIAFNTDAARKQGTISTYSLRTELSAARPFHWINTAAQSQLGVWATPIWVNGSSATVSRSTGRIIPEACTIKSNETPSMPGAGGRAAMSSPGFTGPASERAASQPGVRTTRTRILKDASSL